MAEPLIVPPVSGTTRLAAVIGDPVRHSRSPRLANAAFAAAVERGYLAVVRGGADVGAYLVEHPQVDEIHITGSDRTHDAIVWGPPGPERDARRKRRSPLLKKPISSELGNISPVLLVPGPYTDDEIAFQAQSIAAGILNNASFNCNAV